MFWNLQGSKIGFFSLSSEFFKVGNSLFLNGFQQIILFSLKKFYSSPIDAPEPFQQSGVNFRIVKNDNEKDNKKTARCTCCYHENVLQCFLRKSFLFLFYYLHTSSFWSVYYIMMSFATSMMQENWISFFSLTVVHFVEFLVHFFVIATARVVMIHLDVLVVSSRFSKTFFGLLYFCAQPEHVEWNFYLCLLFWFCYQQRINFIMRNRSVQNETKLSFSENVCQRGDERK